MPFCHLTLTSPKPKDSKYPTDLRTIGDHLRARRLDLGLLQKDVAVWLGVAVENVRNWEWRRTKPAVRFLPAIRGFLGYDPCERGASSFAEALRQARSAAGLTQCALARRAGFDPSTIGAWERGENCPDVASLTRLGLALDGIARPLPTPFLQESLTRKSHTVRKDHQSRRDRRADRARRPTRPDLEQ